MNAADLYDVDFAEWARVNAELLRSGNIEAADLPNIAEEIEDMAKARLESLESRLKRIVQHLLKWEHQPQKRSRSWRVTLFNQRYRAARLLRQNPSFRRQLIELLASAYPAGRRAAAIEMGCDERDLPGECPYTIEQILNDDYLPA